jgi:hypothetical protein
MFRHETLIRCSHRNRTKEQIHKLARCQNYSHIVCGLYVNQDEFVKGAIISVKMNLLIALQMLAEFPALDFHPSFTLGQLEFQMVIQSFFAGWAVLDQRKVCDVKSFFADAPIAIDWSNVNQD